MTLRLCSWALLILSWALVATGKLPDDQFDELLRRVKSSSPRSLSQLRQFIPGAFTNWNSPESLGPTGSEPVFVNTTFKVVLYHIPPFVIIEDPGAKISKDAGNANQTRTVENGMISGLTIDFLVDLSTQLGCTFEYIYPCRKSTFVEKGECTENDFASSSSALKIVEGGVDSLFFSGVTGDFCLDGRCLAAGAIKISSDVLRRFDSTYQYMEKGMKILTKASRTQIDFMSWAGPFDFTLWIVVIAEVILVAIIFMVVEGYGTNPGLPENKIGQFFDAFYWAFTIILGVADKGPTTNAGRTLTMAQLFFTLILIAIYTGNLNSFLSNSPQTALVDRFEDTYDQNSPRYSPTLRFCTPQIQNSVKSWLDLQETMNPSVKFVRVEAIDVVACMDMIYNGTADLTFYDEPVLLYYLADKFYSKGKCGYPGGYCSNDDYSDEISCLCPSKDSKKVCIPTTNKWTVQNGNLVVRGDVFNPFGYGLAFRKGGKDFTAFSQATQYIKEEGNIEKLMQRWYPDMDAIDCSGERSKTVSLELANVQGMMTIVGGLAFIGLVVGLIEHFVSCCVRVCPCCACIEEIIMEIEEELKEEHNHAVMRDHRHVPGIGAESKKVHEEGNLGEQGKVMADEDLPPPPNVVADGEEITVIDALLEIQVRMDRIEELLASAVKL